MSSMLTRRVVSLKLPTGVLLERSEELLDICKQRGAIIYQHALDLAKAQLLIEVEEYSAMRLLNKFKRAPLQLGGYIIRVAPTSRQEMIRAQAESNEKIAPKRKPTANPSNMREFNPFHLRAENGFNSAVLFAHVDKETAEVKHDILRKAFSKYGCIVSLISFRHKGTLYCLVQYSDNAKASESLRKLNGTYIYDDCCILRVQYSNVSSLEFKDDGRGYKKFIHHNPHLNNPQVEVSRRTVDHLQVWNPKKGIKVSKTHKISVNNVPFNI